MNRTTGQATTDAGAASAEALARALDLVAMRLRARHEAIVGLLQQRDRVAWGRFRRALAEELGRVLARRFDEVREAYLSDDEAVEPESTEAPAEPVVNLLLVVDRTPAGLLAYADEISTRLAALFGTVVPGLPLFVGARVIARADLESDAAVRALLRADATTRVWE